MGSNESKHLFLALALNLWVVRPTKEFCGHLPSILCYPLLQRALWLGDARELARAGEAILVSVGIETKLGMESSGLGWNLGRGQLDPVPSSFQWPSVRCRKLGLFCTCPCVLNAGLQKWRREGSWLVHMLCSSHRDSLRCLKLSHVGLHTLNPSGRS